MKRKQIQRFFTNAYSVLTVFMLLSSNFMPLLYELPSFARADDAVTQEVSEEPSTPTVEEQAPEESTPTPVVEEPVVPEVVEEEVTPTPVVEESTPVVDEVPVITEEKPVEVTVADSGTGALNTIVENVLYDCNSDSKISCVTTDKADYSPVDVVTLNGYAYTPNTDYKLVIYSDNNPAVRHEATVTANEGGDFEYQYKLDGHYRPQYYVEVHEVDNTSSEPKLIKVVAKSSFTDSALICQNDVNGANDEPGQKDLTRMCYDESSLPTTLNVQWNWDDAAWPGGNSGDACALFDTDNDGKVNYALCVTINGNPASFTSRILYTCGDTKTDRCANKAVAPVSAGTTCSISVSSTDPFPTGDYSPNDTNAQCSMLMADIPSTSKLVDVCSYPSGEPNSDPSDCIIATQAATTKLEVQKVLVPNTDSGLFDLSINGTTYATNVGDGGTTGEKVLLTPNNPTAYTFGEAAGTGTSLSNYTSSVVCKDGNGTGNVISTTGTNPWTINIAKDKDVVCKITNTLKSSSITVTKTVVNDNGGTKVVSDFPLYIGQTQVTSGVQNSLPAGNYVVSETTSAGYAASVWGGDCAANGSITLSAGQNLTCTITNNDIAPKLTVTKVVTNDNGGTKVVSDFPLFVNGNSVTSGVQNNFNVGSYTISETNQNGYTGVISGDCAANGSISLSLGDVKSCTITNNDIAPKLTVTKVVVNDNGGTKEVSDFPLFVNGNGVTSGVQNTYNAGTLTVSETNSNGYAATFSGDCNENGSVTLGIGDIKSCTITNNDIAPKLTVTKIVINDNGGDLIVSSFSLFVSPTQVTSGVQTTFNAGNYTVSETGVLGYSGVISGDCASDGSITLNVGDVKSCTITNNDIQPKLTVTKIVINDNGGTKEVSDFPLYVGQTQVTSGVQSGYNAGQYTISETGSFGYEGTISGDCATDGKITLHIGDVKSCTITNNDVAPKLTVTKVVDGGDAVVSDFPLYVGQTLVTSGVQNTFSADSYTVSETNQNGYTGVISGDCDTDGSITLNVGDVKSCTITNSRDTGSVKVNKNVDLNGDGDWNDADEMSNAQANTLGFKWNLDEGDDNEMGSTVNSVNTGTHSVDENTISGYRFVSWYVTSNESQSCTNPAGTTLPVSVEVTKGQTVEITLCNKMKTGNLTITKDVLNPDGEPVEDTSTYFAVNADSIEEKYITDGQTVTYENLPVGTYTVTEGVNGDYTFDSFSTDSDTETEGAQVTVVESDTVNVTVYNKQKPGTIIVSKEVIDVQGNDEATSTQEFDVVLGEETKQISDEEEDSKVAEFGDLNPGSYTFTETPADGFTFNGCYRTDRIEKELDIVVDNDNPHTTIGSNETQHWTCINQAVEANLDLVKTNNKTGLDLLAGDNVTYTLVVTAPTDEIEETSLADVSTPYIIKDVKVTDLTPQGFSYVEGTWTANSSVRGPLAITQPSYSDLGVWGLGDMVEGEVVTLTYVANISTDQDAGLYKDLAWTQGTDVLGERIIGSAPMGLFAGTEINVVEDIEEGKAEVLGVSLPNTGAAIMLVVLAVTSLVSGLVLVAFGLNKRKGVAVLASVLVMVGAISLINPNSAYASTGLSVRVEQPKALFNKESMKLGFVALDIDGRPVSAQCEQKGPGDASFSNVGSAFNLGNGGSNADCVINSSVLDADGVYEFKVTATAGADVLSETVSMTLDTSNPGPVIDYGKTKGVCKYTLKFKTADDGQTTKVQIFRSTEKTFIANSSTLVAEIAAVPNDTITYTDTVPDCDKEYFYAIRALDNADNTSPFIADSVAVVTPDTTDTNTDGSNGAGNEGTNNGEVQGSDDTNNNGEEGTDNGEVKGEEDDNGDDQTGDEQTQNNSQNSVSWNWIIGIILVAGILWILERTGILQKVFQKLMSWRKK